MSEEEKIRRSRYSLNRKRTITVLGIATAILLFFATIFGFIYYKQNDTYYVNYTEKSNMSYSVKLKPNSFYEDDVLEEGMTYVVSLIDTIQSNVNYSLTMDNSNVEYSYNYIIDAVTIIKEKNTKSVIFEDVENLYKSDIKTVSGSTPLAISHPFIVDFNKYNDGVKEFINELLLQDKVESELLIRAQINIVGNCQTFVQENAETHQLSIKVPLATELSEIQITSTIPEYVEKSLACKNDSSTTKALMIILICFAIASGLSLLTLIIFIYATRNDDINYAIKVKRIVSNYKSYIQILLNEFDFEDYKILKLKSFKDLLEIRDTIQQPILMYENDDKTSTKFMVPTSSKLVYVFEILVEKYARYYQLKLDDKVKQSLVKEDVVKEEVVENNDENVVSAIDENIVKAEVVDPIPDTVQDTVDVEFGGGIDRLNYSFEAKLILSTEEMKERYKDIVGFAKSYGVKVSSAWKKVRIFNKGKTYAILIFKGKTLCVAYSLDPKLPENEKYKFVDMSEYKKYVDTPSMLKITSDRKKNLAIEILQDMFNQDNIKNKNLNITIDLPKKKSKQQLFKEGLIRK